MSSSRWGRWAVLAVVAAAGAGVLSASAAAEIVTVGGYSYGEAAVNALDGRLNGTKLLCASGKPVVGGGVDSSGGFDDSMMIYSSRPFDGTDADKTDDDGWWGQVDRSDFGSEAQTVKVYAICDTLKTASSYSYNK